MMDTILSFCKQEQRFFERGSRLKRIILVVTVAAVMAALLAFSGVAGATHNPEQPDEPPHDFVTGGGKAIVPGTTGEVQVTISAQDTPDGPRGHIEVKNNLGHSIHADVQCLGVFGDRAVAAGPARAQNEATIVPEGFWLVASVHDVDEGSGDRVRARLDDPATALVSCNTPPLLFPAIVTGGNYTVHDTVTP